MKLFEVLPSNFFQIFSGSNRVIYADILFMINEKVEEENSYSFEKGELLDLIEYYFESTTSELITDEEKLDKNRDKATYVLRKLKQYGWIDIEYGADQKQYVDFEDYAVAILKTLTNLDEVNQIELGSSVYRIYSNISTLNPDKGYMILQETVKLGKNLILNLKSLSANIRKYMKTLLKMDTSNEERVSEILEQLLGEYKENVIDQAYFYMKTRENPIHYKRDFLLKLNELSEDEIFNNYIVKQIIDTKDITLEQARAELDSIYDYLMKLFPDLITIMREIDRKNSKYISSAIERIRIIINHDINLEGKLLEILKELSKNSDFDTNICLSSSKTINTDSLYQIRQKRSIKEIAEFSKVEPPSKEEEEAWSNKIKKNYQFSKKAIRDYVNTLLKEKEELSTSEIPINKMDDIVKIYLIFIYSNSDDRNYDIIWKENFVNCSGNELREIEIPEFIIKKRC